MPAATSDDALALIERRTMVTIRAAMARHPSNRIATHGRRIAERAGARGAQAIQRARANIHKRLDADVDDLSLN